ncbi:hypothetical protein BAY59_15535 [Prauserella coralliicola]|nr:hypothetical protein BAY59_15535 [Prauserella coralliicola]
MTLSSEQPAYGPRESDPSKPSPARVYDYILGGSHYYPVDEAAGNRMVRALPLVPALMRYNREFLQRVVHLLTGEYGIRQFIDFGSGLPTEDNVHEVAQAIAPETRVVYIDYERGAVDLGREILADNPHATSIHADIRQPEHVLADPDLRGLIDFDKPVGLLMFAVLHFISDEELPMIERYRRAVCPGSYLVISHGTTAQTARVAAQQNLAKKDYDQRTERTWMRNKDQIAAIFGDAEILHPGIVHIPDWRPTDSGYTPDPDDEARQLGLAGVGRLV